MRIALDTNRYVDLVAGVRDAVEVIGSASEVIVPFVVLAELHDGFRTGNKRAENEAVLASFLRKPGVRVIYANADTVDLWADIGTQLRSKGKRLSHNDQWIAAICMQQSLKLYSRDSDFRHVSQLSIV